jgi:chromosome partitioning protein
MPLIVVANAKGGVGKSTLASNLAGFLARQGHRVMLGDMDRQQSALEWLARRPATLPPIEGWQGEGEKLRTPKGVTHVVLDTPAGLHGKALRNAASLASHVIVPLQPSLFDAQATLPFVRKLQEEAPKLRLALVLNRVRENTLACQQAQQFLHSAGLQPLTQLRDTQNYIQLAARGLTLWDVAPSRVERDLPQWQPLLDWLA